MTRDIKIPIFSSEEFFFTILKRGTSTVAFYLTPHNTKYKGIEKSCMTEGLNKKSTRIRVHNFYTITFFLHFSQSTRHYFKKIIFCVATR